MEVGSAGADFIPEKRMVRWEPQAPPRVQSSGRGCSQSGSGRLMAVDMASYSIASLHGITLTSGAFAASRIALTWNIPGLSAGSKQGMQGSGEKTRQHT